MRNKIILAMAAAGMMCATSAFAGTDGGDGPSTSTTPTLATAHITVTGTINNSPCDIKSGDDNLIVDFGQFSNRHLQESGKPADARYNKNFAIHLENCSFDSDGHDGFLMSKVTVSFAPVGGGTIPTNGVFPNSSDSNMAKNVGVQFLDYQGTVINSTYMGKQQLAQGNNQINLTAQLVNTGGGSVTTGPINIPLTYTLTYS
ncbi:fimbrial protein [Salmonella enterica subsp. enterica serovar Oranienburg]|nr:fimbrial protein [Salmonella enterica subsp. enterica serovar Oranienburg]